MRVVVTGANSFIGRHVVADLVARGHDVTAIYRKRSAVTEALEELPGRLQAVQLDIADRGKWSALPARVDAIIHVAGVSTSADVTIDDMIACNVVGTRNVIAYAESAGAERVIHASSLSVHGRIEASEVDEHTPSRDPDVYGATKLVAERLLAETKLPTVAIRLPGVIGPGAHRAWLPTVMARIESGAEISIFNPDAPFNNAVHVRDLQAFFGQLLDQRWQGFHAFPVGAADCVSIRQVVERLIAGSGSKSTLRILQTSRQSFLIRSDYAKDHFGYRASPITGMLDWYATDNVHGRALSFP